MFSDIYFINDLSEQQQQQQQQAQQGNLQYGPRGGPAPGPRGPQAGPRHPQQGHPQSKRSRYFIALFDYDPATMSPNPESCDEELPFSEGDTIKVSGICFDDDISVSS